ncbi:MAG: recombination protein O N-terminal domain-containing protein [Flavobacteriales bacterium]|nr:recombination protein O N-terminal domain-containing protein [Flavobacteriales bacterium]
MIKQTGIILSRTQYGSDSVILNILTTEGLISVIRKGLSRHKSQVRMIETSVGMIVEYVCSPSSGSGALPYIKEMTLLPTHPVNAPLSPLRAAQKLFMCDITRCSIRGSIDDAPLFYLLEEYLSLLSSSDTRFLCLEYTYKLCAALGFAPRGEKTGESSYYDMCEGVFTPYQPSHKYYLTPSYSTLFFSLDRSEDTTSHMYNIGQWEKLWHILMTYYSLHVTDFHIPRSLTYLKEICRLEFFS